MATKVRKTNIHIETTVTTSKKAVAYSNTERKVTSSITISARMSVHTLSADVWFKIYINDQLQSGMTEDSDGFNTSFYLHPEIGDLVKIEAYRVPDTFDTATLVGTCYGQITESGFASKDNVNVTTQEKNEVKMVRKYR